MSLKISPEIQEVAQELDQTAKDLRSFARIEEGDPQAKENTISSMYRGAFRREQAARALRTTVVNSSQLRRKSGPKL